MAKNKSELEVDCQSYREITAKLREAHDQDRFIEAVEIAVSSFEFIDGMMQFEKRFEKRSDRKSVESIEYVLQFAPLLLDAASLEKVSVLLKTSKRIDKNTLTDESQNLAKAHELLWQAHRLWNHLERQSATLQDKLRSDIGGDQDRWRWLAEKWEQMGYVRRKSEGASYRLSLVTRLENSIRGKCPSCGATGKTTMERFLEAIDCPKCSKNVCFVLLDGENG